MIESLNCIHCQQPLERIGVDVVGDGRVHLHYRCQTVGCRADGGTVIRSGCAIERTMTGAHVDGGRIERRVGPAVDRDSLHMNSNHKEGKQ